LKADLQKENIEKRDKKLKNIPPHDLYSQALKAFNELNYPMALNLWDEITDNFPEHKLLSNAFFWQGEAHYQMQDFDNAILKYNKIIEKYAESSKYPSALLKAGLSCFALNKNKEGELRLKELIEKFPDRAEAKRAGIFLHKR
jgi:tol-pal system protein YbgF